VTFFITASLSSFTGHDALRLPDFRHPCFFFFFFLLFSTLLFVLCEKCFLIPLFGNRSTSHGLLHHPLHWIAQNGPLRDQLCSSDVDMNPAPPSVFFTLFLSSPLQNRLKRNGCDVL